MLKSTLCDITQLPLGLVTTPPAVLAAVSLQGAHKAGSWNWECAANTGLIWKKTTTNVYDVNDAILQHPILWWNVSSHNLVTDQDTVQDMSLWKSFRFPIPIYVQMHFGFEGKEAKMTLGHESAMWPRYFVNKGFDFVISKKKIQLSTSVWM